MRFFLSERLSQDPLENFFGCQRQRSRANENPNVQDFCKNTQALRVINSVCGNVPKGNCRGRKQAVDMEMENKPLSKRRRVRKQPKCKQSSSISSDTVTVHASNELSRSDIVKNHQTNSTESTSATNVMEEIPREMNSTDKLAPDDVVLSDLSYEDMEIETDVESISEDNLSVELDIIAETTSPVYDSKNNVLMGSNSQVENHICNIKGDPGCTRDVPEPSTFVKSLEWLNHSSIHEGIIDQAFGPGSADEELSRVFNFVLRRCDFWTLDGSEWINDQVS